MCLWGGKKVRSHSLHPCLKDQPHQQLDMARPNSPTAEPPHQRGRICDCLGQSELALKRLWTLGRDRKLLRTDIGDSKDGKAPEAPQATPGALGGSPPDSVPPASRTRLCTLVLDLLSSCIFLQDQWGHRAFVGSSLHSFQRLHSLDLGPRETQGN